MSGKLPQSEPHAQVNYVRVELTEFIPSPGGKLFGKLP
jgi:hypothetical protein